MKKIIILVALLCLLLVVSCAPAVEYKPIPKLEEMASSIKLINVYIPELKELKVSWDIELKKIDDGNVQGNLIDIHNVLVEKCHRLNIEYGKILDIRESEKSYTKLMTKEKWESYDKAITHMLEFCEGSSETAYMSIQERQEYLDSFY